MVLLHNVGVFGKERVISTTKQEHFSPQRPSILENFASMDDSWRQHKGASFWYTTTCVFCRPNIAFPNKRLPTRSCSSKVSMALARSWKSLSSFESIPGMLCIACLGRDDRMTQQTMQILHCYLQIEAASLIQMNLDQTLFARAGQLVPESLPLWWSKIQLHASFFQPAILL